MLLVANLGIKIDKSKSICYFLCRNQRKYLSLASVYSSAIGSVEI